MAKFADDSYLLVGSSARSTIATELNRVKEWANHNNFRLNTEKQRN